MVFLYQFDLSFITGALSAHNYRTNGNHKPPFSYATLICMAMRANGNKMTLSAIYNWIKDNFMFYKNAEPCWQVGQGTEAVGLLLGSSRLIIEVPTENTQGGQA